MHMALTITIVPTRWTSPTAVGGVAPKGVPGRYPYAASCEKTAITTRANPSTARTIGYHVAQAPPARILRHAKADRNTLTQQMAKSRR
jgi:hypothetical protein